MVFAWQWGFVQSIVFKLDLTFRKSLTEVTFVCLCSVLLLMFPFILYGLSKGLSLSQNQLGTRKQEDS